MTNTLAAIIVAAISNGLSTNTLHLDANVPPNYSIVWDGNITNTVLDLGKQGIICDVYGHQWRTGPTYCTMPPIDSRVCVVCGKTEEFSPGAWK